MNKTMGEKIADIRETKLIEQKMCCAGCGREFQRGDSVELAHILPQRKWLIGKYGAEIIHHPMNLKATHTGDCNSEVQMSPNKTDLVAAHVESIRKYIEENKC